MKIYVDELPKCCKECPCMNDDIEYGNHCNMICEKDLKLFLDWDDCQSFRNKDCPLQTTQSLKQQVREEVVEEIRKQLKDMDFLANDTEFGERFSCYSKYKVLDILLKVERNQVKGESNDN